MLARAGARAAATSPRSSGEARCAWGAEWRGARMAGAKSGPATTIHPETLSAKLPTETLATLSGGGVQQRMSQGDRPTVLVVGTGERMKDALETALERHNL